MALIESEEAAKRLARVILSDIELYSRERPVAGESLEAQIAEGARLFGTRVVPALHSIFATVVADRRARSQAAAVAPPPVAPVPNGTASVEAIAPVADPEHREPVVNAPDLLEAKDLVTAAAESTSVESRLAEPALALPVEPQVAFAIAEKSEQTAKTEQTVEAEETQQTAEAEQPVEADKMAKDEKTPPPVVPARVLAESRTPAPVAKASRSAGEGTPPPVLVASTKPEPTPARHEPRPRVETRNNVRRVVKAKVDAEVTRVVANEDETIVAEPLVAASVQASSAARTPAPQLVAPVSARARTPAPQMAEDAAADRTPAPQMLAPAAATSRTPAPQTLAPAAATSRTPAPQLLVPVASVVPAVPAVAVSGAVPVVASPRVPSARIVVSPLVVSPLATALKTPTPSPLPPSVASTPEVVVPVLTTGFSFASVARLAAVAGAAVAVIALLYRFLH